jgi:hypothetical protein
MDTRPKRRRQAGIARHHQDEPARPADAGEIPPQRFAFGLAIMTQHHTGQTSRQALHRRTRIRQPTRVGEQPERRQASNGTGPPGSRPRPGEDARVHAAAQNVAAAGAGPTMTTRQIADS